MRYRWRMAAAQPAVARRLTEILGLSPLLAQCLINRGFADPAAAERFLNPRLRDLADPFALPNMAAAVGRLFAARERDEGVIIFGDYDVDGVTATALLREFLGTLGWNVSHYLPHRLEEGYGLSLVAVEKCLQQATGTLLVAVDCGSTAVEPIQWLGGRGVDVLVFDHHQASDPLPPAVAIVNPQLGKVSNAGERLPFSELCSAGLAFKLAHALVKEGRKRGLPEFAEYDIRPFLDLVALGTIADLVPLIGENRILVAAGLERLNQTSRAGLLALREVAGIKGRITGYEVGFQLGPRLNAAGRLEDAEEALQLLMAQSAEEAAPLAQSLDLRNRERQQIERSTVDALLADLRARFQSDECVIVEGKEEWHVGVVGIVASRVLQEFHRPTIIIGSDGVELRGSGRSIDGFDLAEALRECSDLLVKHGGHAMAAGLSISRDNLVAFRKRLNEIARRKLLPEQFQPALRLDAQVRLDEVNLGAVDELGRLEQTGMGNPGVNLVLENLTLDRPCQKMGSEKQHARLWVRQGATCCEAVCWNVREGGLPEGVFDLAVAPQINEFQGRRSVQLKVLDWRHHDPAKGAAVLDFTSRTSERRLT